MTETIQPAPMTTTHMEAVRACVERTQSELSHASSKALLADRDYWRNRCPVETSDVETAGITWEKFDAWCSANGFKSAHRPKRWEEPKLKVKGRSDIGWVRGDTFYGEPAAWPGNRMGCWLSDEVALFVDWARKMLERPAFAILDEMAATEVGS